MSPSFLGSNIVQVNIDYELDLVENHLERISIE